MMMMMMTLTVDSRKAVDSILDGDIDFWTFNVYLGSNVFLYIFSQNSERYDQISDGK